MLFRRALELNSDDGDYHAYLAWFLDTVRNDSAAERFYRRALELNPTDSSAIGNFSQLLAIRGNEDEARLLIDQALKAIGKKSSSHEPKCYLRGGFSSAQMDWTEQLS